MWQHATTNSVPMILHRPVATLVFNFGLDRNRPTREPWGCGGRRWVATSRSCSDSFRKVL